jgi:hypothetical protein
MLVVVVSAGVGAALYARGLQDTGTEAALTQEPVQAHPLSTQHPYMGVFQPGAIASYTPVMSVGRAVGLQPSIVLYCSVGTTRSRSGSLSKLPHTTPFRSCR